MQYLINYIVAEGFRSARTQKAIPIRQTFLEYVTST
jgi:hypothetical protein